MPDMKQIAETVQDINTKIADVQKMFDDYSKNPPKDGDPKEDGQSDMSVADLWGDQRYNPWFLNVSDYFGVEQKDYNRAQSKIEHILRWAESKAKSKDIADIMRVIDRTSKFLPSAGMGEKRYNIFYRYLRLKDMGVK